MINFKDRYYYGLKQIEIILGSQPELYECTFTIQKERTFKIYVFQYRKYDEKYRRMGDIIEKILVHVLNTLSVAKTIEKINQN